MKFTGIIIFLVVFSIELNSQSLTGTLSGTVSFVSSRNVYVKFKSTEGILSGDTLYSLSDSRLIPELIVNNLSSSSCVCTSISLKNLTTGQPILAVKRISAAKAEIKGTEKAATEIPVPVVLADTAKKRSYPTELKQKINGSISVFAYSDFSNTGAKNSTQLRYNYALDARNIGNSKFSVENYISFRHKIGDWLVVKNNVFDALKIYTFAVKFDPGKTTRLTLGRTINYRISSIGAMDGLQVEQKLGMFTVGAVVGTRPDYRDYGFNSKLLQYGGYLSFDTKSAESFSESSIAVMEQMNNMKTDRRFLYFQHSNSILKNFLLFQYLRSRPL